MTKEKKQARAEGKRHRKAAGTGAKTSACPLQAEESVTIRIPLSVLSNPAEGYEHATRTVDKLWAEALGSRQDKSRLQDWFRAASCRVAAILEAEAQEKWAKNLREREAERARKQDGRLLHLELSKAQIQALF